MNKESPVGTVAIRYVCTSCETAGHHLVLAADLASALPGLPISEKWETQSYIKKKKKKKTSSNF